jgi:hypothetical protein
MMVDQQGDCEDKAILVAAILDALDFDVSLIRLPNHMAVGVHLDENLTAFDYYIDEYYYLESTRFPSPLGSIPNEYQDLTNISLHPLFSRPLLVHSWKNATRFTGTDDSDYVKLKIIVENLGRETAYSVEIQGAFYSQNTVSFNQESTTIPVISPQTKQIIDLQVNVPQHIPTTLKTKIFLDNMLLHEKESSGQFP